MNTAHVAAASPLSPEAWAAFMMLGLVAFGQFVGWVLAAFKAVRSTASETALVRELKASFGTLNATLAGLMTDFHAHLLADEKIHTRHETLMESIVETQKTLARVTENQGAQIANLGREVTVHPVGEVPANRFPRSRR